MKNRITKFLVFVVFVSSICLAGCSFFFGEDGEDGSPGNAYIAYSWVSVPLYLSTNDPSMPQSIYNGTYYDAVPGTYSITYEAWDGSFWQGTYTIYVNPGEPGSAGFLFTDGEDGADGEDIYFELTLYSTGPTLWEWLYPNSTDNSDRRIQEQREIDRADGLIYPGETSSTYKR